jgi:hypothetical protein
VMDPKRIIGKNGGPRRRRGTRGCWPQKVRCYDIFPNVKFPNTKFPNDILPKFICSNYQISELINVRKVKFLNWYLFELPISERTKFLNCTRGYFIVIGPD